MYTSRFVDTALKPTLLVTILEAERISDTGKKHFEERLAIGQIVLNGA